MAEKSAEPLLGRRTALSRPSSSKSSLKPETRLIRHAFKAVTVNVFKTKSALPSSWRAELSIPFTCYSCSSFTYSAVGLQALVLFTYCPEAIPEYPRSSALWEARLVVLQGVWSYCSDVMNAAQDSMWHCVDRFSAVALFSWQLYKLGFLLDVGIPEEEKAWLWLWLSATIFAKVRGYRGILDGELHAFRFWHIVWHITLPFSIASWQWWRWHNCEACGEWQARGML